MDFYSRYKQQAVKQYPSVESYFENSNWQHSVSDEIVELPFALKEQMEAVVSAFFILKRNKNYQNSFKEKRLPSLQHPQDSVLMAYDFHVNDDGNLKLIEVNTNASGFLISQLASEVHDLNAKPALVSLKKSFETEWKKYKGASASPRYVLIVDEKPLEQKMYGEFLMYKDFFKSFNWKADICDSQDLTLNPQKQIIDSHQNIVDFIYNRTTDFYFEKHPVFAEAYLQKSCCFSPHPADYHLLADKRRLCEWSQQNLDAFLVLVENPIKKVLLASWVLNASTKERAWDERKKYFFKPLSSYGGRQVYRGKGLTRTRFERLFDEPFLFQEHCPPGRLTDQKGNQWKFDIRVFAYEGHIQHIAARLYQGQVTNFFHLGGGFASVRFCPPSKRLTASD